MKRTGHQPRAARQARATKLNDSSPSVAANSAVKHGSVDYGNQSAASTCLLQERTGMSASKRTSFAEQLLTELPSLLRVARRLTRSEADAQDLVQSTVERAIERQTDLRDTDKLRAWLLRVQRSVLLNSGRGLRNRLEVLEGGRGDEGASVPQSNLETEILERSMTDELEGALDQLPSEWREALLLREVEELSYEEIAQIVGCPIGTVRSRLARARASLLESLSEQRNESWQDATKSGSKTSRRGTTAK